MEPAVVSVGETLIVITRRLYPEDLRRHFIGRVVAASETVVRLQGHAWVANAVGVFERRPEVRTRIFSLAYGGHIILVVPPEVDPERLTYRAAAGRLSVTDGAGFDLNITEFGAGH